MIHVASLLHDDVIDDAETRRGLRSLNAFLGNKLAILAGDFLLARASVTLASLRNYEVIQLLSQVIEDLVSGEILQVQPSACVYSCHQRALKGSSSSAVARASVTLASLRNYEVIQLLSQVIKDLISGEMLQVQPKCVSYICKTFSKTALLSSCMTCLRPRCWLPRLLATPGSSSTPHQAAACSQPGLLQMTTSKEQLLSMEHYIRKTFFKTASLMANSCQAIAILGAQPTEVSSLAREYGHHLGLAFQVSLASLFMQAV